MRSFINYWHEHTQELGKILVPYQMNEDGEHEACFTGKILSSTAFHEGILFKVKIDDVNTKEGFYIYDCFLTWSSITSLEFRKDADTYE